ncbi:MAG: low molecular weight protein arginine phosphatase [Candidatus Omnitrophica bacterium]|nr:low molecular weight protein arginine phosphatase [Candidatus Omnitrophota bacterium]
MSKIKSVLFVCTGNSCRSIMAEGFLKRTLKELGKDNIMVSSAGVSAIDGFGPTRETLEVMKREGVDVSDFKSRSLNDAMIISADLILVMAAHHMSDIIARVPKAASKTHILKQYGQRDNSYIRLGMDISDPIGKPVKVYEYTLGEIKREVDRIARVIARSDSDETISG